jgi:hypothetical protein
LANAPPPGKHGRDVMCKHAARTEAQTGPTFQPTWAAEEVRRRATVSRLRRRLESAGRRTHGQLDRPSQPEQPRGQHDVPEAPAFHMRNGPFPGTRTSRRSFVATTGDSRPAPAAAGHFVLNRRSSAVSTRRSACSRLDSLAQGVVHERPVARVATASPATPRYPEPAQESPAAGSRNARTISRGLVTWDTPPAGPALPT